MGAIISIVVFGLIYFVLSLFKTDDYYESGQNRGRSIARKITRMR